MASSSQWAEVNRAQVDARSVWASTVENDNNYWVIDLYFQVYLDPMIKDENKKITLHSSIIYAKKNEAAPIAFRTPGDAWYHYTKHSHNKPMLAYLCGGPGDENTYTKVPTITKNLVERGYQVLHLDYRGTGKSTKFPGCAEALRSGQFKSDADLAKYLTHFTQDKIAQDLESVRLCLSDLLGRDPANLKLTLLAQSFGGWIALTYLSYYPTSLSEVLLTAAMAPFTRTPQEVYAKLYERVINRNEAYYAMYPSDAALLRKIVSRLWTREQKGVSSPLPDNSGRLFNYDTLLSLGRLFGSAGRSSFDKVHNFLVELSADLEKAGSAGPIPQATLAKFANKDLESFRLHQRPLYGLLHEAIYCHGPTCKPSWAAKSVGLQLGGKVGAKSSHSPCPGSYAWLAGSDGKFNPKDLKSDTRIYFTGEMIIPGMLYDEGSDGVAELLAQRNATWPYTYDPTRLASNLHNVPVKSVVYKADMYVDWETSLDMGSKIGGPCKVWLVSPGGELQLAVKDGRKFPVRVDRKGEEMNGLWDWVHGAVKAEGKTEKVLDLLFDEKTW
ncbi:Alpha/Beta hydrolase fold [Naviculisporaceae sp. PSN 640]